MVKIRMSRGEDRQRVIEIWCSAVDATHEFLSAEDRTAIGHEVEQLLPQLPLWLAVDDNGRPLAFMALSGSHMDSLFVDAAYRGRGIGRRLVEHARAMHSVLTTDVNEQNPQALGFYERLGFRVTGRSSHDEQNRPYPLLHLKFDGDG